MCAGSLPAARALSSNAARSRGLTLLPVVIPSVAVLPGKAGAFGAARGDVDRRWLLGQVIEL